MKLFIIFYLFFGVLTCGKITGHGLWTNESMPVLVDFWAEWCGPCRLLGPVIDKLATDYVGKVKVGKIDTESSRDIAMRYDIRNIPTVLLFKNGEVAEKFVGLRQEKEFKAVLDA